LTQHHPHCQCWTTTHGRNKLQLVYALTLRCTTMPKDTAQLAACCCMLERSTHQCSGCWAGDHAATYTDTTEPPSPGAACCKFTKTTKANQSHVGAPNHVTFRSAFKRRKRMGNRYNFAHEQWQLCSWLLLDCDKPQSHAGRTARNQNIYSKHKKPNHNVYNQPSKNGMRTSAACSQTEAAVWLAVGGQVRRQRLVAHTALQLFTTTPRANHRHHTMLPAKQKGTNGEHTRHGSCRGSCVAGC
jgi:hypothetical protein